MYLCLFNLYFLNGEYIFLYVQGEFKNIRYVFGYKENYYSLKELDIFMLFFFSNIQYKQE